MKNNNYPTWLVPLDIAKELKEIGFNKDCAFYYDERLLRISPYHDEDFSTTNWNDKRYFRDCVSLPTWEQVFAWFRKRGLYGFITFDNTFPNSVSETFSFEIRKINRKLIYGSEENSTDEFNCYEEAREALVKALILTYKQDQLK